MFNPTVEYPVVGIIGRRGSSKTLLMVALAKSYSDAGVKVVANFDLFGINYIPTTFEEVITFPDYLHDCILFLDELHVGADSYKFLDPKTQGLTTFITQIRKLRVTMIYTTQNTGYIAKRIRNQSDYIIQAKPIDRGVAMLDFFEIESNYSRFIKTLEFDGRPYFPFYDTNQVITLQNTENEKK